MDENKQSFEGAENMKPDEEDDHEDDEDEEDDDEEFAELDDEDEVGEQRQLSEFENSLAPIEAELREVPIDYTLLPHEAAEFQDQVEVPHQEALLSATQAAQAHTQNQLHLPGYPNSSSELSLTSVTQSISSTSNPTLPRHRQSLIANVHNVCMPEVDQQSYSDLKAISAVSVVKTPTTDGYNWRKYGQKQVKSPQGSRSYYKCTYSDCCAKKIECSDHSNRVIEIICKGQHTHDPPRKINCTRESRLALSTVPNSTADPVKTLDNSSPSTFSKEPIKETAPLPETKGQDSNGSDENVWFQIKEENLDEPESKRRVKKSNSSYSGSLFKPGKKPKFVVHAAGDVGISGDGYRWRKYGQKMVKGNPHPRNYYRCTSAACPVRKHIERAVDNSSAVIITYKGVHDHDMPVPKKRHGPPSAPLVAAAAPASMNNVQVKKTPATKWSVDTEGELTGETLDIGGEKAMESARTLLSIGFEIKPC
ncbi:probable WRKY transcription factor 32 isoform X2 [Cornus florida]|uniref:probable WRKY transcription factor 32 isoform X2 n=1 Tax=Cornus florida TaxID=4283 RepID=UPI0028A22DE9|nr:probable WRKY transcription factor 32 isoform X2 [Cornus florida]